MVRRSLNYSWASADIKQEFIAWEGFNGMDLVSDTVNLAKDSVTFALNADFTTNYGAITKCHGIDKLFQVPPPIKGSALVTIKNKQYILIANDKDLYAVQGGRRIYSFNTKDTWQTGTGTVEYTAEGTIKIPSGQTTAYWQSPVLSLGDWAYEATCTYLATVPTGSTLLVEYANSEDNVTWSDWVELPSNGIPDTITSYMRYRFTLTGATTDFYVASCTCYIRGEFQNPVKVYSGLSGNYVNFATYKDKVYIAHGGRPLVFNGTNVRLAGVDAPTSAATIAASTTEGAPNGKYTARYTFVNADKVESNPSPVSAELTVTSKQIDWTIPVGPEGTVARRLYRTTADGKAHYFVTEIADNTTTTYTDNKSDAELLTSTALADDNNVPPEASNICLHGDVMFYVDSTDDKTLWYSKPGMPEQVPQISGKRFYLTFPSSIRMIYSFSSVLFVSGYGYTKFISGKIFHSDPTVSDIVINDLGGMGALHQEVVAPINTQKGPIGLAMLTDSKELFLITPTVIDDIFSVPPISGHVQPLLYDSADAGKYSVKSFRDNLFVIFTPEHPTLTQVADSAILKYNATTRRWQGVITAPVNNILTTPWRMYAVMEDGSVGRFLTAEDVLIWGKRWGSYWGHVPTTIMDKTVPFIVDTAYKAPSKSQKARYRYLQLIVSGDSITDNLEVHVVVDGVTQVVKVGPKEKWNVRNIYGSTYGFGRQSAVISGIFPLNLPPGRFAGIRLYDESPYPITVYAVVLICEPVRLMQGGI